jgi:hypothetical protein
LLHTDGIVVSHLFLAADIGVRVLSVAAAIVLGAAILQVDTVQYLSMLLQHTSEFEGAMLLIYLYLFPLIWD